MSSSLDGVVRRVKEKRPTNKNLEKMYQYFVYNLEFIISVTGEKISPIEVDSVLLTHPDVSQGVAFGVPDEKYGEEVSKTPPA